jgi:DNA-binding NtrC family response regulator
MIVRALQLANGNRADAARRLGISRQSLYTKLANLGLD